MFELRRTLFFVFLALPWLNPFAPGPSSAMVPWLVSLACVGLAVFAAPPGLSAKALQGKLGLFWALSAGGFAAHMLWSGVSIEALATLVAWTCVAVMVGVGSAVRGDGHDGVRNLAKLWLGVALVSVAMAMGQYVHAEQWLAPWISHSSDGAAYANLRQRNQFATLCGIGLLALLYLQHTRADYRQTAWPWLAVLALAVGNGLSSSRTGGLQWLLITAALWCWRASVPASVRRLGYGALAMYALVVLGLPWFADAVGNPSSGLWGRAQENAGGSSRWWLFGNVLELIAQKPWLGWGWRELAYAHYSTSFGTRFVELLDNAHNLPLHLAVELGLPYALLWCGAVLLWLLRAKPWRDTDPVRQLAWGVLLLLGVHSMVEYPLWYGPFLMTLGLCVGLLRSLIYMPNKPFDQSGIAQAAIKYVATALLALAAYAAFDYHRVGQIYLSTAARSPAYSGNALGHAQQSWLYQRQARFAELVTTPLTPQSAPRVLALAAELVHFSPEPRVIEALIESAVMLHFDDVAMFHIARYKAVYPTDYAAWSTLK